VPDHPGKSVKRADHLYSEFRKPASRSAKINFSPRNPQTRIVKVRMPLFNSGSMVTGKIGLGCCESNFLSNRRLQTDRDGSRAPAPAILDLCSCVVC
jgi:hypothetical protein